MQMLEASIFKGRKKIFSEKFDYESYDAYAFIGYYFGKARYEHADYVKFKLIPQKSVKLDYSLDTMEFPVDV